MPGPTDTDIGFPLGERVQRHGDTWQLDTGQPVHQGWLFASVATLLGLGGVCTLVPAILAWSWSHGAPIPWPLVILGLASSSFLPRSLRTLLRSLHPEPVHVSPRGVTVEGCSSTPRRLELLGRPGEPITLLADTQPLFHVEPTSGRWTLQSVQNLALALANTLDVPLDDRLDLPAWQAYLHRTAGSTTAEERRLAIPAREPTSITWHHDGFELFGLTLSATHLRTSRRAFLLTELERVEVELLQDALGEAALLVATTRDGQTTLVERKAVPDAIAELLWVAEQVEARKQPLDGDRAAVPAQLAALRERR